MKSETDKRVEQADEPFLDLEDLLDLARLEATDLTDSFSSTDVEDVCDGSGKADGAVG